MHKWYIGWVIHNQRLLMCTAMQCISKTGNVNKNSQYALKYD
jgi:hypothetical protein